MKNFIGLIILSLLLGCQSDAKKKKGFEYNRTKTEENKNTKQALETNIVLNSDDRMKFDRETLSVPSGKEITLTLNHNGKFNKQVMGHNFVLLKDGVDVSMFAQKASSSRKTEYIPEGTDKVIANTKMLGGGESDTISFIAPEKGVYTYICSFPGHWALMKGKFIVI